MNRKVMLMCAGGVTVVVLLATVIVRQTGFHLTKTDPRNNDAPNQYTTVSFTFNKALSEDSGANQITLEPEVAGVTAVTDNTVTFTPAVPYQTNVKYTAKLSNVMSAEGETTGDTSITFKPQYYEYNRLPADVRERLNKQSGSDDNKVIPYSPDSVVMSGINNMVKRGLSDSQVTSLQKAFYQYSKVIKQEIRGIDLTNIEMIPHDPESEHPVDSFTFKAAFNDKTYPAKVDFFDITTLRLYLYDNQGKVIFDSGNINS